MLTHGISEQLNCQLCQEKFGHQSALVKHHMADHAKVNFNCNLCAETFRGKNELIDHVTKKHMTNPTYKCESAVQPFQVKMN